MADREVNVKLNIQPGQTGAAAQAMKGVTAELGKQQTAAAGLGKELAKAQQSAGGSGGGVGGLAKSLAGRLGGVGGLAGRIGGLGGMLGGLGGALSGGNSNSQVMDSVFDSPVGGALSMFRNSPAGLLFDLPNRMGVGKMGTELAALQEQKFKLGAFGDPKEHARLDERIAALQKGGAAGGASGGAFIQAEDIGSQARAAVFGAGGSTNQIGIGSGSAVAEAMGKAAEKIAEAADRMNKGNDPHGTRRGIQGWS